MANVYVYSGAAGAGTGADWTNAYTTLGAAATAKAAGDIFFVAHDHAETAAAAKTITFAGTEANPNRVFCVNRAGSVPPVSADLRTTATITTTGAFAITIAGSVSEMYGIVFSAGDSSNSASINVNNTSGRTVRLNSCALRLGGNNAGSRINLSNAATGNVTVLRNTTVQFTHISQSIMALARAYWRATPNAITGAVFPTALLTFSAGGMWLLEGVDLSAMVTGKTLVSTSTSAQNLYAILRDCKLGAGVTVAGNPTLYGGTEVSLIRSDSGNTNYRSEKYGAAGTQTTETTIVLSGGASDGTTPISWKIVTTSMSRWDMPFDSFPISVWNETVGTPVTVTLQGIWGGGAVPLNDEIWIDVAYLGTSGFPLAVRSHSTKADGLATGTNIPTGTGTWGGSTTKFAMNTTFTPQLKGPFTIFVRAAKASSTFYVDPKPVVT